MFSERGGNDGAILHREELTKKTDLNEDLKKEGE